MTEVVIVSQARTPLGAFNGGLAGVSGPQLCGKAIEACVQKSGIAPESFDNVIVGNVVSAGLGQNPAKQCAMKGGLPKDIPCTLVNKVCCSSLKALTIATQQIKLGESEAAVIAGFESMSQCPHYIPNCRQGVRLGNGQLVDSLVHDGLWDFAYDKHMGALVDKLAADKEVTREDQDRYAIESFRRANEAWEKNAFAETIIPIETPRNGTITKDENITKLIVDKVPKLRPSFTPTGTITAANSSSLADGAAAMTVCSAKFAEEKGLKPIAKIISYADAGCDPAEFPLATIPAARKALERAGLKTEDIDLWEVNEAFAAVPLMFIREMGISEDVVNVLGGACAMGHPLGCTGARILTSLIDALRLRGKKRGLATLCNGGGGATAVIVELL